MSWSKSAILALVFAGNALSQEFGCKNIVTDPCGNNGECLPDGNCFCKVGYVGLSCETSKPLSLWANC